jgi:phosphate-selective porin OprO/OprP
MKIKTSLLSGAALGMVLALGLTVSAQAQDTKTSWKGAPQFQNDTLTFKVRGRTYADYVYQDVNRDTGVDFEASNTRLRTARLGVEGTWNANWAYKAEVQFTRGAAEWEDLILEYKPTESTSIMIGNFKALSLENLTSSRYTTFMERGPYNDVLNIGRVATVQAKANGQNWTAAVAVSGDSLNAADVSTNSATGSKEQVAIQGRLTNAPILADENQVHLGVWARQRDRGDQANYTYAVKNNTHYGSAYTTTGAVGVSDTQVGVEGAWLYKNFSLQGEWANISVDRPANADADLQAYYVAASWFPTGEMRRYEANKGEFGRTKILNPVTAGGMGAIELAARYDNVDLGDVLTGGEYSAWTLGANWYPHPYVRFMANYTQSKNDNRVAGADVDVNTLQFRAQFDF